MDTVGGRLVTYLGSVSIRNVTRR